MSHPGMKPVSEHRPGGGAGRYEAAVELTMAGDWFLLIDATLRDGRTLRPGGASSAGVRSPVRMDR